MFHLVARRLGNLIPVGDELIVLQPTTHVCPKSDDSCRSIPGDLRTLYHWSSAQFSAVWSDTLSVLVARGRAQVSVAAAITDWPKRIRDMRYVDHEDYGGID